jgi:hypothetical protein
VFVPVAPRTPPPNIDALEREIYFLEQLIQGRFNSTDFDFHGQPFGLHLADARQLNDRSVDGFQYELYWPKDERLKPENWRLPYEVRYLSAYHPYSYEQAPP